MPVNNNALFRYRVLDRCFSNKHKSYTIEDLLDIVNENLIDLTGKGVSLRQLRVDIQKMRERLIFDAPIIAVPYDGKRCYYRYSDSNYSIFKSELTDEDLQKLHSTIEMLGKYRGIPANAWLEEVISNLECRFGVKTNSENVVSFGQNEQLKGLEYLSDIIDSTINHQPLEIEYKTYSDKVIVYMIHPYFVKQYNNRWFLIGLDSNTGKMPNVALDRILKLKQSNIKFIQNNTIDFKTYFNDIVGVSLPKDEVKKEHIILKFTKGRFPYVVSKPIHPSQKIVDSNECTIDIFVRANRELCQQIFSFIPDIEVVSPPDFRSLIKEKIEENLKNYSSMQNDCIDNVELCTR